MQWGWVFLVSGSRSPDGGSSAWCAAGDRRDQCGGNPTNQKLVPNVSIVTTGTDGRIGT